MRSSARYGDGDDYEGLLAQVRRTQEELQEQVQTVKAELSQIDPATAMMMIATALTSTGIIKEIASGLAWARTGLYFPYSWPNKEWETMDELSFPVSKRKKAMYTTFHKEGCDAYEQGSAPLRIELATDIDLDTCEAGGPACGVWIIRGDGSEEYSVLQRKWTALPPDVGDEANGTNTFQTNRELSYRLGLEHPFSVTFTSGSFFGSKTAINFPDQARWNDRIAACNDMAWQLRGSPAREEDVNLKACGYALPVDARRESIARKLARQAHAVLLPIAHLAFVGACVWTLRLRLRYLKRYGGVMQRTSTAFAVACAIVAAAVVSAVVLVFHSDAGCHLLPSSDDDNLAHWLNDTTNDAIVSGIGVALVVGGRSFFPAHVDAVLLVGALLQVAAFATDTL